MTEEHTHPTVAEGSPEPQETESRKVDRKPQPKLRKIHRGTVALVGIAVMCLLLILTLQYSRETLTTSRLEAPKRPGPPPADIERIESYELPSDRQPTDWDRSPGTEPLTRPNLAELAQSASTQQRSADLRGALKASLVAGRTRTRPSADPAGGAAEPSPTWAIPELENLQQRLTRPVQTLANGSSPAQRPAIPGPKPGRNLLALESSDRVELTPFVPTDFMIQAGTYLPAVLTHRVVSDQPGQIRAVLTRDIYDSLAGRHLLLPRGTIFLGEHRELPSLGQTRLAVLWTRLRTPDGVSYDLSADEAALPSASVDGSSGVAGATRHHWARRFGAAALVSLVGAGVQLSQPDRTTTREVGPGEAAAGALGLDLGRLSESILRQYADLPPTIHLQPGTRMFVLVPRDLSFPITTVTR